MYYFYKSLDHFRGQGQKKLERCWSRNDSPAPMRPCGEDSIKCLFQTFDLSCGFPWQFVTWYSDLPYIPRTRTGPTWTESITKYRNISIHRTIKLMTRHLSVGLRRPILVHIHSPVTDNCPSWISGRERMTVDWFNNISYAIDITVGRTIIRHFALSLSFELDLFRPIHPGRFASNNIHFLTGSNLYGL